MASIGLGVYRGTHGGLPIDDVWVWALGGAIFLASVGGVLFIFRELAIVCRTEGRLRVLARKALDDQPDPEIPALA